MATHAVVCVYDRALGAYLRPFTAPSQAVALRSYLDAAADPNSEISKHPADYELHQLAWFDDIAGIFTNSGPEQRVLYRHTATA